MPIRDQEYSAVLILKRADGQTEEAAVGFSDLGGAGGTFQAGVSARLILAYRSAKYAIEQRAIMPLLLAGFWWDEPSRSWHGDGHDKRPARISQLDNGSWEWRLCEYTLRGTRTTHYACEESVAAAIAACRRQWPSIGPGEQWPTGWLDPRLGELEVKWPTRTPR